MLLAAATLSWMLNIATPDGDSTLMYDTQAECEAARDNYEGEFDRTRQHIENHAICTAVPENESE